MNWKKYTIETTTDAEDILSEELSELGACGIELEDNVPLTEEELKGMFVDLPLDLSGDDGLAKVSFYAEDRGDGTISLGGDEPRVTDERTLLAEVREMLTRLRDEKGITIMVSSHILDELSKVADAYGIIHEGTLLDEFTAKELHERCGNSLILRTDDQAKTQQVLENMGLGSAAREPDGSLRLTRGMEQSKEIAKAIVNAGIGLEEIYLRSKSLEDYYLGMTGGTHNG